MRGKPLAIGHRGAAGHAPENTLASFRRALELGADAVELDVRLSRDGVPVVIHDATLERTTDGEGKVADHDLDTLVRLDAGRKYGRAFAGQRIPTLAQVLDEIAAPVPINVELKPGADPGPLVERVVRAVEDAGAVERVIYSSFHPEAVIALRARSPRARLGILFEPGRADAALEAAARLGAENLHAPFGEAAPSLLKRCRQAGLRLWVWTVNDPAEVERLCRMGVDGVYSDFPERVAAAR